MTLRPKVSEIYIGDACKKESYKHYSKSGKPFIDLTITLANRRIKAYTDQLLLL